MPACQPDDLLKKIRQAITKAASESAFAEAARLAELGKRAERVSVALQELNLELAEITDQLRHSEFSDETPEAPRHSTNPSPMPPGVHEANAPLSVAVNWITREGSRTPEVISDEKASRTLRRFLERILNIHGPQQIAELAVIRTGRGPLVSQSPRRDFVNSQRPGVTYSHKQIGVSGWYVITQSSTKEKVRHLREVIERLKLDALVAVRDQEAADMRPGRGEESDDDDSRI